MAKSAWTLAKGPFKRAWSKPGAPQKSKVRFHNLVGGRVTLALCLRSSQVRSLAVAQRPCTQPLHTALIFLETSMGSTHLSGLQDMPPARKLARHSHAMMCRGDARVTLSRGLEPCWRPIKADRRRPHGNRFLDLGFWPNWMGG